jgi:N-acetylmuramoyl-L-alanine amidase
MVKALFARWRFGAGALLLTTLLASTDAFAQPAQPSLQILAPLEATTTREQAHVLGRTSPGTRVWVAGEPAQVFSSGVFARDGVALAMGKNLVPVEALASDGTRQQLTLQIERIAPPPGVVWPDQRLFIDGSSLRPDKTLRVAPGEAVEVTLRATPAQQVWARLPGQAGWHKLHEPTPGQYRGLLRFTGTADLEPGPVQVWLLPARSKPPATTARQSHQRPGLLTQTPGAVGLWSGETERLYRVGSEGVELLHGLHEVRLGGPFLAEMAPGVVLRVTGQQGDFLRVQLSDHTTAWAPQRALQPLPAGTPAPQVFFTSLALSGTPQGGDTLELALPRGVPVVPRAVNDAQGRHSLELDIHGAHHATTWITHRQSATLVREVSAEQAGPGLVRLRLALNGPRLWGWRVDRQENSLRLTVLPRPHLAQGASAALPLAGLRVALEPGHGGPTNLGAVGATGVPEKDVNRWTVQALQAELQAAGAEVTVVREDDTNPPLRERARRVVDSQAHVFLSVHANATDTTRGFLRVSGTSMYYKHNTGRDLAAALQRQVLQDSGLADFGLVGNFNYTPLRLVTTMPAALVELAFMSHPGDEAKLLDPAFRGLLAKSIRQGLEAFLRGP